MLCAFAFVSLRENQTTDPYRVYLDRLVVEDIQFHTYVDHRETRPFDDIVLYFRWLACGSHMTYPHLSECVMRQFGYMEYILINPFVSAPPSMTHRDMYIMFDDYLNHLIPDKE